ncbi:MAG: RNB domain-containing ribonuclease, partial [Firmicutes bacterium]|nr:RNB domain-containing ribonuclease [Bacillota bacterium]
MLNSEDVLDHMRQASYRPLGFNELRAVFGQDAVSQAQFAEIIDQLEKEGDILRTRRDKYGLPEKMNIYRGVIRLSQRGYGILIPDQTDIDDIFVYGRNLNGAMHEDRVLVRIHQRAGKNQRPEGEVIRAITRANHELVGSFEKRKNMAQVIPDDSRQIYPVYVKPDPKMKLHNGDKVLVRITTFPDKDRYPEGKIVEVFGGKGQPGVDLQIVIKKHGLRDVFPPGVVEEARQAAQAIGADDISQRRDLRAVRMVTIDSEDAKDLDDAVSVQKIEGGYRLGVHIADVSHYVREESQLDSEALARGTSVYLINRVLPMLPPELSNGICSLSGGM